MEYQLLLDMDCVHRRKGKFSNTSGRLYIFNKCLGFHAKGMKSMVIHYKDILNIKKSTKITDRLKGKIKVYIEDGGSVAFKRIKHRDSTFDSLMRLWQDERAAVQRSFS
jgi:GRAM domain